MSWRSWKRWNHSQQVIWCCWKDNYVNTFDVVAQTIHTLNDFMSAWAYSYWLCLWTNNPNLNKIYRPLIRLDSIKIENLFCKAADFKPNLFSIHFITPWVKGNPQVSFTSSKCFSNSVNISAFFSKNQLFASSKRCHKLVFTVTAFFYS